MNPTFHKNFPFKVGVWIWELWTCVGKNDISLVTEDDIKNIAQVCKDNNIAYVIIKSGDGIDTWLQWEKFSQIILDSFHALGIKVYTWTYCYGDVPLREAAIAMWSLDKGSEGHVFDAESEYQGKPESAKTMLQAVRGHAPDAFLAYAPFPIIDYHTTFPYIEFGKYCNAVMPQIYFGDFGMTPLEAINWTIQQFDKWKKIWNDGGLADSIQPIIPLGQAYDNIDPKVNYVQNGADIKEFIDGSKAYFSVNFWSFQHINKPEVWDALKNSEVDTLPLENTQNTTGQIASQDNTNKQQADSSTATPSVPVTSTPQHTTNGKITTPQHTSNTGNLKGSDIVGINSGNGVHLPPLKKKHIDYARDFILFLLRLFRIHI